MSELSTIEEVKLLSLPFKGQRWYHQLLILSGGFGLWLATFVATVSVIGEWTVATADTSAGLSLRRQAAIVAGFVSTTYYMILWMYGYGGLVLSPAFYPIITVLAMRIFVPRGIGIPHSPFITGDLPARFIHSEILPIMIGTYAPFAIILFGLILYIGNKSNTQEILATFAEHWPDTQVRVLFTIQSDMSPELKRVIRESHCSSTDSNQTDGTPTDDPRSKTPDRYKSKSADCTVAIQKLVDTVSNHVCSIGAFQLPEGYAAWVGRDTDAILVTLEGAVDAE